MAGVQIASLAAAVSRWFANIGFVFQLYNLLPVLTPSATEPPPCRRSLKVERMRASRWRWLPIARSTTRVSRRRRTAWVSRAPSSRTRRSCSATSRAIRDRKAGDDSGFAAFAQPRSRKTIVMVTHDPHVAERATPDAALEKGVLAREEVPA